MSRYNPQMEARSRAAAVCRSAATSWGGSPSPPTHNGARRLANGADRPHTEGYVDPVDRLRFGQAEAPLAGLCDERDAPSSPCGALARQSRSVVVSSRSRASVASSGGVASSASSPGNARARQAVRNGGGRWR